MKNTFQQYSDSLWLYPSKWLNYQSGMIRAGSQCWLIDPGITVDETLAIKSFLDQNKLTCLAIVLTHFHWDHILGAGLFAGVPLITHQYFPVLQNEFRERTLAATRRWMDRSDQEMPAWDLMHRAAITIETRTRYQLNGLEIQLLPLPGHTADQIGVYLPSEKSLWAADMLSDLEIPYISSSGAAYLHSLQKLQGIEIDRIVPGHGHPTEEKAEVINRLERDTDYLVQLSTKVIKGVAEYQSLADIKKSCAEIQIIHPDENCETHEWNVESVYQEAGGDTGGVKIGWEREWE